MKSLENNFRLMVFAVLVLLVVSLAVQSSPAQSVSVSPVSLPTGVPTVAPAPAGPYTVGNPAPPSGPETVIVTISPASVGPPVVFGSPVTFSAPSVGNNSPSLPTDNPSDFVIDGNSCVGVTFTSPNTCLVTLHYNASLAPATTLETALLTISSSAGTLTVPLSGAYGSIKLFSETNISTASTTTGFNNLYTIASSTQNLSCSEGATATLSGTPDGLGYVLVDNYITLATGIAPPLTPVAGIETNNPAGNLCSGDGSTAESSGENDYQNCFTTNYEDYADALPLPLPVADELDPDTFANPKNTVLSEERPNTTNAGGVPPISISSFLTNGSQQTLFTLLTSGAEGVYDNSTLFLQTTCTTPGGVVPGATITGNPTPVNNPVFDSNPGNSCSMVTNLTQAPPASGTTPVFTLIGVPQQLFYQLVQGTSAAADVCMRMSCEQDSSNSQAPMCAGVLIQCWDPTHTTLSGANCQSVSLPLLRNAYNSISFDSPDIPLNGDNYLYGPTADAPGAGTDACSGYLGGTGACATGTGPGLLEGGDPWACTPGSSEPCTPQEPSASGFNTTTPPTNIVSDYTYSSSAPNCSFSTESYLAGDLCPLNILTQYIGEGDGPPGGPRAGGGGSIYFPTANHPLPTQSAMVGQYGWVNSTTANVNFTTNAATYPPAPGPYPIPPANGFVAAPIYSLTYGITPASSPLPDTTYPVPGDVTAYNANTVENFGSGPPPGTTPVPFCSLTTPPLTPSGFSPTANILPLTGSLPDGLYNLHYFATDCALTEGLIFNPQGALLTNPTANWASFQVTPFGIDTVAPTFSSASCVPAPNTGTWYGGPSGNITVTCTNAVTDSNWVQGTNGSGFLPLLDGIQGSQTETVSIYTNVAPGTTNASATAGAQTPGYPVGTGATPSPLQISDLAGNPVSGGVSAGTYQIDLQAPTVTASAGNSTVGGAAITVSFTCNDGAGSGIPSGGCTISGTPANYVPNIPACSPSSGSSVTCGGTIPTTIAESGTITVSGTDLVGNLATSQVSYTVSQATPMITFGATVPPSPTYLGGNFTVSASTTNTDSAALTYSAVSGPCALVSGATFSSTGAGTCVVKASGAATANFTAASNTENVTISPATPSITFGPTTPPSPTYLGGNFTVSASTTNTDSTALTYSAVSGPCALVSGATFSSSGAGSCVVKASGAATTNFNAAYNTENVTIGPATPTVTAADAGGVYNGSPFPATATVTVPAGGTADTGAVTFSYSGTGSTSYGPTATAPSTVGTYSVTASVAATTNYTSASSSPAPFSIGAATPTVTVADAGGIYTGSPFPATATVTVPAGDPADGGAVTYSYTGTGSTSYGPTATAPSAVGTYSVTASVAATTNYTSASSTAVAFSITAPTPTLTVTPSSLTFQTPTTPLYPGYDGVPQAITVTNNGSATVVISSVSIGGTNSNDFGDLSFCSKWFTKLPGKLPAGASCEIFVDAWRVSAPPVTNTSPYIAQAYLAITPQGGSAIDVPLTTYVIDPVPSFSATGLSGGKLTFPTTPKGSSSTVTITMTNTGTTPLIFGTLSVPSGATWFSISTGSTCSGETVLPGGNCVVNLTFKPTATSGTDPGSLRIPDNALNSPQAISLSGPI